ncbi:MAG: DUF3084 domain-containing protein [Chthonomonas sp.]|nr:DUF3084 domain-containing protein [Chthonomonas sp.]
MQTSSLTLILVLCLMGGLIAYSADLLGRKLGKKRLTLGHMRPKHTAALLTTGAGVLIPIATIGLMSMLFADVREMLFRTEAIKEELRQVEGKLRVNQKNLDRRAVEVDDLEKTQRSLVREGERLKTTNNQTSLKLSSTRSLLDKAQGLLSSRTAQLAVINKRTQHLAGRVSQLTAEVSRNVTQLASLRQEAKAAQDSARTNQAQASNAANQLREIQVRNLEIERELQDLEKQRKDLQEQIEVQKKVAIDLDQQFRNDLALAESKLKQLQEEQAQLERVLTNLITQGVNVPRTQPMIIARGNELARWTIDANSSRSEAQLGLSSLMRTARVRAESRGAKPSAELEAASLFNGDFTTEQQINNILRDVTSQGDPMVLIAGAIYNHFAGEPIYYQVRVERNTVVYQRGQVIGETRIDGTQDEKRVLEAISRFIIEVVGPKALEDRMLPIIGADAPLGEVDDNQIVSLMQLIRDTGRAVRVQALAAGETRRADRLMLEFRLR